MPVTILSEKPASKVRPLCPLFGECGGCQYQDIPYKEELNLKESLIKRLFESSFPEEDFVFSPIISSPKEYFYRSRLDLNLVKTRGNEVFIGFTPEKSFRIIPAETCFLALKTIAEYLPQLKKEAVERLPEKYRRANLVVKTGDGGKVFWGGIGRRSLRMKEEDYFFTIIKGRKIFYSLETFFQANLSILPGLIREIENLRVLSKDTVFFDLFGGAGLFSAAFCENVKKVVLVEENIYAADMAEYNFRQDSISNFEVINKRAEEYLSSNEGIRDNTPKVIMLDPPRGGLKKEAIDALKNAVECRSLLYLSCSPESLIRDLKLLSDNSWKLEKVMPFDFFPKTRHIETLTVLTRNTRTQGRKSTGTQERKKTRT